MDCPQTSVSKLSVVVRTMTISGMVQQIGETDAHVASRTTAG